MSVIKVEHLTYIYGEGMPDATVALNDVSFEVERGEFLGVIGPTRMKYGEVTSIIEYLTDNLSNTFKLESGGNEDD